MNVHTNFIQNEMHGHILFCVVLTWNYPFPNNYVSVSIDFTTNYFQKSNIFLEKIILLN